MIFPRIRLRTLGALAIGSLTAAAVFVLPIFAFTPIKPDSDLDYYAEIIIESFCIWFIYLSLIHKIQNKRKTYKLKSYLVRGTVFGIISWIPFAFYISVINFYFFAESWYIAIAELQSILGGG
jgi:hypothetical protein